MPQKPSPRVPTLASDLGAFDALPVRSSLRSSLFRQLPLLGLALALAGCVSPEIISRITTTGGKVVSFSFGPKGAEPGRANGFEVRTAVFVPSENGQEITYHFSVSAPAGTALKRVQVEDVTEEAAAFPMVDDTGPKIDANLWSAKSAVVPAGDEHLQWVYTITTSMRVYRFILTDAAGKATEIYHVTAYPDFIKSGLRKKWGANY